MFQGKSEQEYIIIHSQYTATPYTEHVYSCTLRNTLAIYRYIINLSLAI